MTDLVVALGLFLVIEGLIYALFPGFLKNMAAQLPFVPEHVLRIAGTVSIALGVVIVWLARA